MEDRSYDPNEKKEEPADPTKRFMQSSESFIQFLLRKRESDNIDSVESDDDDDEEETEGQKGSAKRRSKLFKNIFKSTVSKPTLSTSEQTGSSTGLQDQEPQLETSVADTNEPLPGPTVERRLPLRLDSMAIPRDDVEVPEDETLLTTETADTSAHGNVERPRVTPDRADPVDVEVAATTPIDTESIRPVAPEMPVGSTREAATSPRVERETVIERSVGNALPVVLVGAEYFARKRADKKLDRKFTERTNVLKQEVSRGEKANQELDKIVRQNRTELEDLKRKREAMQTPKYTQANPEASREHPSVSADKLSSEQPQTAQEKEVQYIRPENMANQERAEVTAPLSAEVRASSELKEAEKGPVERLQERSHEIKDDQPLATASSVGSLIEQTTAAQNLRIQQASTLQAADGSSLPVIPDEYVSKQYKQAVQSGFIAAVVIIILALLAYLVIQ